MKRLTLAIFSLLIVTSIALTGCPGNSSSPTSAGGGSNGSTDTPTFTVTKTPVCPSFFSFGKNVLGTGALAPSAGVFVANKFALPVAGNVFRLNVYVEATPVPTGSIQMAIYTDNAGAPQSLIVQSTQQAPAPGWNVLDVPQTVLASGNYWIAVTSSAGINLSNTTGTVGDTKYVSANPGSLPAVFSGSSSTDWDFSMFADYCTIPGSPTPVPTATFSPTPSYTPTSTITHTQTPVCAVAYSFGRNYQGITTLEIDNGSNASRFTLPVSGIVSALHAYVTATNGASLQMGLYSDSGGAPGTLISGSNAQAAVVGWNNLAIPNTPLLAAGTYWIEAGNAGAAPGPSFALDDASISSDPNDGYSSFSVNASPYSGSGPLQRSFSFYADYCVPGSSPTPVLSPTRTHTPTATPTFTVTSTQTPACIVAYSFGRNYQGITTIEIDNGSNASRFTLPVSGIVSALHAYVTTTNGASLQMGLYSNSGGAPGTLISGSNAQAAVVGWNNLAIPNTPLLAAGTYWIEAGNAGAAPGPSFALDDASISSDPNDGYSSFSVNASPYSGSGPFQRSFSFYADYCVPGSSPTPAPSLTKTPTVTSTPTSTPTVTETPVCASTTPQGVTSVMTPSSGFNYSHYYHFSLPAGHLVGFHLYTPASGAGVTLQMAVYSDSGGASPTSPANVLTQSNAVAMQTGWNTVPFPGITIAAGTYWFCVASNSSMSFASNGGSGTNTGFNSFNTTFSNNPSGGHTGELISIYADYCP